jgi:GT2 family glycosyltransferase
MPASQPPRYDIAVAIVNYNTPELAALAARSAAEDASASGLSARVVVVDNGSTRGDCAAALAPLVAHPPSGTSVACVRSERNLGFTGGNNLAFRHFDAPADAVMLLNSDAEPRAGCLRACLDYLAAHPDVGVLGPKLLDPDGTRQLSCRRFPSFRAALFNRYSLATRLFPNNRWSRDYLMSDLDASANEPRAVDWVSGAAMLVSRRAFEELGPLDEAYFMYAEDVDYCLRARKAGFEVHYLPAAEVVHAIGESSRQIPFRTIWWRHKSMWTFYHKHYSRRVAFFDLLTMGGIAARALLKVAMATARRVATPAKREAGAR